MDEIGRCNADEFGRGVGRKRLDATIAYKSFEGADHESRNNIDHISFLSICQLRVLDSEFAKTNFLQTPEVGPLGATGVQCHKTTVRQHYRSKRPMLLFSQCAMRAFYYPTDPFFICLIL